MAGRAWRKVLLLGALIPLEAIMSLLCSRLSLSYLCATVLSVLVACGGGAGNESRSSATEGQLDPETQHNASPATSAERTQRIFQDGAKLNAAEMEQIAQTGVLPQPFDGPLLSGAAGSTPATLNTEAVNKSLAARKSAVSRVPVYRFFNGGTGAHFFTTSTTERDNVINNVPAFSYEGPAFHTSNITIVGLSPVHRFYNSQTGVHFYTISEAERANVVANLPQFTYEGIAYYASTLSGTGYTALYRFFYAARGFHFYTNSLAERDNIIATLPQYSYEGIGYYVLSDDWQTPAVPHTGIKNGQCYAAGNNVLDACSVPQTVLLNGQQDGHRININPMSYSAVGANPTSDCLRDNVTGLVWEAKLAGSGGRGVNNTFTNLGNNMANDASGYVAAINTARLCGFNDWRLPAVEELYGIVDFGVQVPGPLMSNSFLYTAQGTYLSRTSNSSTAAWAVDFVAGQLQTFNRSSPGYVRLVRGSQWTGQRYIITSLSYSGDSANNAVIDRRTGLVWRRCVEGQVWSGGTCSGGGTAYTHQGALSRAHGLVDWRLPNIKELSSLSDHTQFSPALDPLYFPGTSSQFTWSSTPFVSNPAAARFVNTTNGFAGFDTRSGAGQAHLVRSAP